MSFPGAYVVTDSSPPRRPVLTLDDLASPLTRRPERLHALTASDLAIAFSVALDLGEGKPVGHAQRVCYIAAMLADTAEASPAQRAGVYFGALLHDGGVTLAAADMCRLAGLDEDAIFGPAPLKSPEELRGEVALADLTAVIEASHRHCSLGADIVRGLELPEEAAGAVEAHHERWDGHGFPAGLVGDAIPLEGRILAAADLAESIIATETSALSARRQLPMALGRHTESALDPALVSRLLELSRSDAFWLGLYAEDMHATLTQLRGGTDSRKSRRRVQRFAEVFADIADAKGGHTVGHSRRTAEGAERLAEALELDDGHIEMVRIAALLHDVGLLGVPARIMSKPDILSVTEMQLMRRHPSNSETVLQELAGFEEIALWVARHHERPDGKGYPEMLTGEEIPLESRIIAVADVHAALIAERPHRRAISETDATEILLGAAGTQLDPELARLYVSLL
ncbi:MAG: HD domain-containing phosphohydrolase [Dehalococcoidia bacterium]